MDSNTSQPRQQTALIIGAGPAGLTAAYSLLKKTDIHPIILEASPFIGGISRTAEHHGNRMDLGGHRFFTKDPDVNALWEDLMPLQGSPAADDAELGVTKPLAAGGPDPEREDRVMLVRNRVSRIYYLRKFFDYPISLKLNTFRNMGIGRTFRAGLGYMAANTRKREETSLENFYINRFGRPLYEMFFEAYTEKLWGRHPSQISAEWGAQRVKGLSLSKTLLNALTKPFNRRGPVETSLIEQFHYPKKGPGQYWEAMADEIRRLGGEIRLNSEVIGIRLAEGQIAGIQIADPATGAQQELTGQHIFPTMAVKDLIAAIGDIVPADVKRVATGLPYRDFITVGLLVDKLKLANQTGQKTLHGGVPDNWIYIQEPEVQIGRLQIFNNWSPYMVADPHKSVWIGLEYFCSEGDRWWTMSDEDFIRFAADELVKIGVIEAGSIMDAVRIRVKKAYPAYFDTYDNFEIVKNYLSQIDNLYCIGRNGQHRYNNMDHSMLTALTAVDALLGHIPKEDVWQVNTEKEYHETAKTACNSN
ncbi:MAG TPA: hypothetical protein DCM45_00675 [Clostridiales bacterium]|nr:hypothetical protein [Clostridiales bacterium]